MGYKEFPGAFLFYHGVIYEQTRIGKFDVGTVCKPAGREEASSARLGVCHGQERRRQVE